MRSKSFQNVPIGANAGESIVNVVKTVAGGASSTLALAIAVPMNTLTVARVTIQGSAGSSTPLAVVADASANTLTLAAHGIQNGTPVFVAGSTQPTGITAGTMYYARAASSSTITLYALQSQAVAGGATGLVDFSTAGADVVVYPTFLAAVYFLDVTVANRNGVTTIVGAINKVAMEDVAAWDVTAAANDTTNTIDISVTPDAVINTSFEIYGTATNLSLKV